VVRRKGEKRMIIDIYSSDKLNTDKIEWGAACSELYRQLRKEGRLLIPKWQQEVFDKLYIKEKT
jgi:hypothetical protein